MKRIWKWLKNNLGNTEFFSGAGSAFNLSGDYCNFKISKDPFMDDKKAIMSDWKVVSRDFKKSMNELESEEMSHNLK